MRLLRLSRREIHESLVGGAAPLAPRDALGLTDDDDVAQTFCEYVFRTGRVDPEFLIRAAARAAASGLVHHALTQLHDAGVNYLLK